MIDAAIIGAQKAGTTSLMDYLGQHPNIFTPKLMEFDFFKNEDFNQNSFQSFLSDAKKEEKIVVKDAGMLVSEVAPKTLFNYNPKCQIILLLRSPVSRAYSSYKMEVSSGWLNIPFDEVVERGISEENIDFYNLFISQGLYQTHLEKWYKHFPRNQFCIILFEDFIKSPSEVCNKVFEFLKLPSFEIDDSVKLNVGFKSRSQYLGRIIHKMRRESNPIKKIVRGILPSSSFNWISQRIIDSNKSKKRYEGMPLETKAKLQSYYRNPNLELARSISTDLSQWEK